MRRVLPLLLLLACSPQDEIGISRSYLSSAVGWSPVPDAGGYVNQDQVDGGSVGLHLRTSPPINGAHLASITADQQDMRAPGNAQNGPGVVGLRIGNEGTAQNPVWVDTGTAPTIDGLGGMSKYTPVTVYTPYVYWNGRGTQNTNGPFVAFSIPHTGIGSDGATCLPWVATVFTDGAPDVNPDLSICDPTIPGEGMYSWRSNDAVYFGQSLVWGQPENGNSSYEDCASGSTAATAGTGHIRRACDTTAGTMGYNISVDGDAHWQPLPVAMQGQFNTGTGYGTPTQAYSSGETVLKTWTPNDARGAGDHGLRSWEPHHWNLPGQQTVTGGVLKACLRFVAASGSSQLLCNTTGPAVQTARDSVFLALVGTWITEVRAVAVNTSGTTTPPMDIGLIQYEGTAF